MHYNPPNFIETNHQTFPMSIIYILECNRNFQILSDEVPFQRKRSQECPFLRQMNYYTVVYLLPKLYYCITKMV